MRVHLRDASRGTSLSCQKVSSLCTEGCSGGCKGPLWPAAAAEALAAAGGALTRTSVSAARKAASVPEDQAAEYHACRGDAGVGRWVGAWCVVWGVGCGMCGVWCGVFDMSKEEQVWRVVQAN